MRVAIPISPSLLEPRRDEVAVGHREIAYVTATAFHHSIDSASRSTVWPSPWGMGAKRSVVGAATNSIMD